MVIINAIKTVLTVNDMRRQSRFILESDTVYSQNPLGLRQVSAEWNSLFRVNVVCLQALR